MTQVQTLSGPLNIFFLQNMLEKYDLVSFKEKSSNAEKMFFFERRKTLFG